MIGWLVYQVAHLDPLALLAGAVFLFAAGMPVVGFMLGSQCSPCCGAAPTVCSECTTGKLPNTITVTLSNVTGGCLTTQTFVLKRGWTYVAPGSSQTIYNKNTGWYEFNECTFGFVGRCPQEHGYISTRDIIEVRYRGPDLPPVALFNPSRAVLNDTPGYPAQIEWEADDPIENCSDFSWSATNAFGQTITVDADGAWQDKADSGLPSSLTATFSGFKDYTVSPTHLCELTFTAPFGSGAAGHVSEPIGYAPDDLGPIGSVVLTDAGSGYAKYGRSKPAITAEPTGPGDGGELLVTLAQQSGEDSLPYWEVDKITVLAFGQGYVHWSSVAITAEPNSTVSSECVAHIVTARTEPTLTATAMSGNSDAVLSVSLEEITDAELDYYNGMYRIASISVTQPGTAYENGSPVLIAVDTEDDLMAIEAIAHIVTKRVEPTLSIAGNAVVDITLTKAEDPPARWSISSIAVTDGGSGYIDGETVAVVGAPGDESECSGTPNTVIVHTVRDEPTLSVGVSSNAGSGADLSATLAQVGNVWVVTDVVINDGGADYEVGDQLAITVSSGQEVGPASGEVASVEDGAITSVTIFVEGAYFLDTGVVETVEQPYAYPCQWWHDTHEIESVVVDNSGAYYRDTGEIESVTINEKGGYYLEDPNAEPYVANVAVGIAQLQPSAGTGGEVTVSVNDDTGSPNFGTLFGLAIKSPGSGYLAGEKIATCQGKIWNERSVVLTRGIPGEFLPFRPSEPWVDCAHSRTWCERCYLTGSPPAWFGQRSLRVYWNGSTTTPSVEFNQVAYSTSGQIQDCSIGSFSAVGGDGQTITFSAGGEYEPDTASTADGSCHQCCAGTIPPDEIEATATVSFVDKAYTPPITRYYANNDVFVLSRTDACSLRYQWEGMAPQLPTTEGLGLYVEARPLGLQECGQERCSQKCVLTGVAQLTFSGYVSGDSVVCGSVAEPPSLCPPSGTITGKTGPYGLVDYSITVN